MDTFLGQLTGLDKVGLVQYQDPGCAHAEQSLELRNQSACASGSSASAGRDGSSAGADDPSVSAGRNRSSARAGRNRLSAGAGRGGSSASAGRDGSSASAGQDGSSASVGRDGSPAGADDSSVSAGRDGSSASSGGSYACADGPSASTGGLSACADGGASGLSASAARGGSSASAARGGSSASAARGGSSTNPMSGCLLPYLVPPSQDSPEEMSESIGLASLPHLKVQTLALNQPNATNVNPAASAVGSILSGVATLEHPSHSQSSGVEWNNFTYTSTSPVALHQTHEMYSDPAEVDQTPPIPRVLYDFATASPVNPNLVVGVDQHSTRHSCPECGTRYSERKALNRHKRDRHGRQNVCPCGFSWSPARNYLFENHVRRVHGGVSPHWQ